jgi:dimethylargininase
VIALVRPVSDRFAQALRQDPHGPVPDLERARAQHAAYVRALGAHATVRRVPADPGAPDACFVEDTVVVAGGRALLTRPGAPSRRREVEAVGGCLPEHLEVHRMTEGTLDGGDVLRVGRTLFVGRSGRTDDGGVAALERTFGPLGFRVVPLEVRQALHLKCHASAPSDDLVLLARGFADPAPFARVAEVVEIPPAEAWGANVVGLGRAVLVGADHPFVHGALKARGFDPIPLEADAIAQADGSLTCLSVLIPDPEDLR